MAKGSANPITAVAAAIRTGMSRFPLTSWLIGGEEGAVSHTLRQGLIASLLILAGSWGVGWLITTPYSLLAQREWLLPLRTTEVGVITCTALLVFGTLLLLRSWLRLVQRVDLHVNTNISVVRKALLMWGIPLLGCFPIFSRDVYAYLAQGRLVSIDLNPYEQGISDVPGWFMEGADPVWAESPSPYGPLFLVLAQLVWYASAGIPEVGILLFRLSAVTGVVLMYWTIPKLAVAFGSRPAWALWLCVLNPLSLIVFIPASHNDPLMIGLMLMAAWYALRRRRLVAILLITAAVAIKPIAMVTLPFLVLLSLPSTRSYLLRMREWAFGGITAAVLLVAGGMALGVGLGWFTAALGAGAAVVQGAPVGLLGTAAGLIAAEVSEAEVATVASAVYDSARILSGIVLAILLLRPRLGNPVLWAAYGLTVVVLLSSVIQPWYVLWILPLFAVVHVYRGRVMTLMVLLLTLMVLVSMVGQLWVPQWIDTWLVRSVAAAIAAVYLVYIVFFDPATARLFSLKDKSQRWNAAEGWLSLTQLPQPHASWSTSDVYQKANP